MYLCSCEIFPTFGDGSFGFCFILSTPASFSIFKSQI